MLQLILAAIQAGVTLIPEGLTLIQQLKGLESETGQVTIDQALADSTAAAAAQHDEAQGL